MIKKLRIMILGISLSVILLPLTVSAKTNDSVASRISSLMKNGVKNYDIITIAPATDDYIGIVGTEPTSYTKEQVQSNFGKGWKFAEKELNEMGVYLDENGMIIDD